MRNMSLSPARVAALSLGLVAACVLVPNLAWAQQEAEGFSDVTANVSWNIRKSVPLLPMVSYVLGVFFTAAGLFRLRDWVIDGDKNPLTPVIIHLLVAVFLIMLPHTIRMVTGTFFNRGGGEMYVNTRVEPPRLGAFCKSNQQDCR